MMIDLGLLVTGAVFCLVLLVFLRLILSEEFSKILFAGASGGLIGAFWLSNALIDPLHRMAMLMAGFLIAPFCVLPIIYRLSGRVKGLSRSASGLGAGWSTRMRLLWLPLLRLPVALSSLSFALCLVLCLLLTGHSHG
ncbi:hypothetical protein [Asaia prunellae]|uniref:hypothetical protein n=1 Tax=Asaia prunellae TaxID=610245 RepID=UPI000470BC65|nr:hypothetical protein [Asaia prunellae]